MLESLTTQAAHTEHTQMLAAPDAIDAHLPARTSY